MPARTHLIRIPKPSHVVPTTSDAVHPGLTLLCVVILLKQLLVSVVESLVLLLELGLLLRQPLYRLPICHLLKPIQITFIFKSLDLFPQQSNSVLEFLAIAVPVFVLLNSFQVREVKLGHAQFRYLHLTTHRSHYW